LADVINPFDLDGEARRYHEVRPRYHHLPFRLVRAYVGSRISSGLDVACGTGHSTAALAEIADTVLGCDQSEQMLREARARSSIEFVKAAAESLPFANESFDLVTICMGFHWVEQEGFLREARRVLKPSGYLCVDNYGFVGRISEDPAKQKAHSELFSTVLPQASRRAGYPTEDLAANAHFVFAAELKYEHRVPFDAKRFVSLIMTWSNFQILDADRRVEAVRRMSEVYEFVFAGGEIELPFAGSAMLFRGVE
jgi:SAM-dependent methyltransferase